MLPKSPTKQHKRLETFIGPDEKENASDMLPMFQGLMDSF